MHIIFLGGIFTPNVKETILRNSIGVIQNAADVLQAGYIDGFAGNLGCSHVEVVNLPFIGSFPRRFRVPWFVSGVKEQLGSGVMVTTHGFLNVVGIKHLSRFLVAYFALRERLRKVTDGEVWIVCYSMHIPFTCAALFAARWRRTVRCCLLVLDLPEFMASGRHWILRGVYQGIWALGYSVASRMDSLVVITQQMMDRFPRNHRWRVIEGISPIGDAVGAEKTDASRRLEGKYVLYSGTLDERYGVMELVTEFATGAYGEVRLVICGEGDCRERIQGLAASSSHVEYLGQLQRGEVVELQRQALYLVNPRRNVGDYTKYSFPSKVMEYMASGTPVLMYRLDGIPDEYYEYCIVVADVSGGLRSALRYALGLDGETRNGLGMRAAAFVREQKSGALQTRRVIEMFES